jgi:hypothetical protein
MNVKIDYICTQALDVYSAIHAVTSCASSSQERGHGDEDASRKNKACAKRTGPSLSLKFRLENSVIVLFFNAVFDVLNFFYSIFLQRPQRKAIQTQFTEKMLFLQLSTYVHSFMCY